jgi:hypothetical protein
LKTHKPVLCVPLAIIQQTINEGSKFGSIYRYDFENTIINEPDIFICNYDQLKNIDCSVFLGVLDESVF